MTATHASAESLFTAGRSHSSWLPKPVSEAQLRALYELAQWAPTS